MQNELGKGTHYSSKNENTTSHFEKCIIVLFTFGGIKQLLGI